MQNPARKVVKVCRTAGAHLLLRNGKFRREPPPGKIPGLVYSRFNNPNLEVLEDRLVLWEGGETAAVFSSGMAAISTTLWAYLRPNDVVLMSEPLYGGTETLISHPASTTHSGVPQETRERLGVTDAMVRISVGIEDPDDLIADLGQALDRL